MHHKGLGYLYVALAIAHSFMPIVYREPAIAVLYLGASACYFAQRESGSRPLEPGGVTGA